jgi:UDP-N-acetyl-D-mannosaminuronic acid dehydrogenase
VRLYGADRSVEARQAALADGEFTVAVYGLGKIGLPLACVYAELTGDVVGVDADPAVVEAISAGRSPVEREPGLPEAVAGQVERGHLRATTDAEAAATAATIHVVIVPTPLAAAPDTDDGEPVPDLSAVEAVVEAIGAGLAPGDAVLVESTIPPGTCAGLVEPRLAAGSGLDPDRFGVAHTPERTSSGRALRDVRGAYPRVVGGTDPEATDVAALVIDGLSTERVIRMDDARTAAAVKLFEGLYRDVNIALANELARLTDDLGVDVRAAIEAANTQPYCDLHEPGPGVGGHCIPYYPYFVTSRVDRWTPLVYTARDVNDGMPRFAVRRLDGELSAAGVDLDGATVAVLGVTYRPGVAETAHTPARPVVDALRAGGADVLAVDPLLDAAGIEATVDAEPVPLDELGDRDLDAAVVVTPHEEFEAIDWDAFDDLVVLDGRDSLPDLDHRVYTIGRGRR